MAKILKEKIFEGPTIEVAKNLLGKYLVRKYKGRIISGKITEVEAYDGPKDKASHASRGLTKRNFPMFGPAGQWYVYFTYGLHWMLNIVTGKKGYPAAILIRGVEGINGPARVTKFFHIDGKFNGKSADKKNALWIEDRGLKISNEIKRTPRIGVQYAGPLWSRRRYRFLLKQK